MKTNTKLRRELIEVCIAGTFQKTSRIDLVTNSKGIVGVMHLSQPESQPKHLDHYG